MKGTNLKNIGLQFFAEPAPGGGGEGAGGTPAPAPALGTPALGTPALGTPGTQGAEPPAAGAEPAQPENNLSADVNKMVAAEVQKILDAREAAENEAKRLAKMKDDERLQYEKEKAEKERADAIAELNAYKLKDEAVKIARETGLPAEFLDLFDFRTMTAEKVNESIKTMSGVFKKAVENALNAKLGQPAPGGGSNTTGESRAAKYAQEISRNLQGVI